MLIIFLYISPIQSGKNPDIEIEITQITDDTVMQTQPKIFGNNLVWVDHTNNSPRIIAYDYEKKVENVLTNGSGHFPDIGQTFVVWRGAIDNGNGSLSGYNLILNNNFVIKERKLNTSIAKPQIYNSMVVYIYSNSTGKNIHLYDLNNNTEIPITAYNNSQGSPDIWKEWIVWDSNRYGDYDIFAYNINNGVEKRITWEEGDQIDPIIYENYILFDDNENGKISLYNLKTNETQTIGDSGGGVGSLHNDFALFVGTGKGWVLHKISTNESFILGSDIINGISSYSLYENMIVYSKNNDIYLLEFTFPEPPPPTQSSFWSQYGLPISLSIILILIAIIGAFIYRSRKESKNT